MVNKYHHFILDSVSSDKIVSGGFNHCSVGYDLVTSVAELTLISVDIASAENGYRIADKVMSKCLCYLRACDSAAVLTYSVRLSSVDTVSRVKNAGITVAEIVSLRIGSNSELFIFTILTDSKQSARLITGSLDLLMIRIGNLAVSISIKIMIHNGNLLTADCFADCTLSLLYTLLGAGSGCNRGIVVVINASVTVNVKIMRLLCYSLGNDLSAALSLTGRGHFTA